MHMDANGKIVEDESLAFGRPVTVYYLRPENVFFLDETGDNTHGKDDGNRGGQRKVVPKGEIPKELVGVKDSHFTVTPASLSSVTRRAEARASPPSPTPPPPSDDGGMGGSWTIPLTPNAAAHGRGLG